MTDNSSAFELSGVWQVINRHRKLIASFVGLVVLITAILVFFVIPKSYKSTAVIVAANPVLADKSRMLNNNIQHLYSPYGNGDDLNRLEAISKLDTVFIALVNDFKLEEYYDLSGSRDGLANAIKKLKDDITVTKTEHDELHVSATFKDRQLAVSVVNKMVELIAAIAEVSWKNEYTSAYEALQSQIQQTEQQLALLADSIKRGASFGNDEVAILSNRAAMVDQLQQFYKASNEYQLAFNKKSAALVILQKAFPALKHDKPRKADILLLAALASLAFGIVAALIYDRTKYS